VVHSDRPKHAYLNPKYCLCLEILKMHVTIRTSKTKRILLRCDSLRYVHMKSLSELAGTGNNGFLHYLDTGAFLVGEQHLAVFWVRVPAKRSFLVGWA
jgi:hypothetical protein